MRKFIFLIFIFCCGIVGFAQQPQRIKATDLEKLIRESTTPLIINMWATWCAPCVQEIPYFQEEAKKHAGDSVKLILVSLDFKEAFPKDLAGFMEKRKISATVLWLDETNADYFGPKVDPKWSGAIPATLFINNKKGYRNFVEDQLTHETLQKEIMAMLK